MKKTWKTSSLVTLIVLFAGAIMVSSNTVEARPQYKAEFQKTYTKVAKNHKIDCFVCHGKKADGKMDKEKRNAYAKELGKALGKENVKDKEAIKAALMKIEKDKSAVEGKTYGDLLNAGELPVKAE